MARRNSVLQKILQGKNPTIFDADAPKIFAAFLDALALRILLPRDGEQRAARKFE